MIIIIVLTQLQSCTTGPPLDKLNVYKGITPSNTDIIEAVNPKFVNTLKIRFTSCLYPSFANLLSSSVIDLFKDTLFECSDEYLLSLSLFLSIDNDNLFVTTSSIVVIVEINDDDDYYTCIFFYYYLYITYNITMTITITITTTTTTIIIKIYKIPSDDRSGDGPCRVRPGLYRVSLNLNNLCRYTVSHDCYSRF